MFEKQSQNKENILSTDREESEYMNMWLSWIDMATEEKEHIKPSSCDENEILNAFEEVGLQLSKNDSQKNEKVQADDELMNC